MTDLQKKRERAIALQRGMNTRGIEQEINLPKSGHDQQEEGVDEEASPMEEYLWIEQHEAFQIEVHREVIPISPTNPSTRMQVIFKEYLILDEVNIDSHLLIH